MTPKSLPSVWETQIRFLASSLGLTKPSESEPTDGKCFSMCLSTSVHKEMNNLCCPKYCQYDERAVVCFKNTLHSHTLWLIRWSKAARWWCLCQVWSRHSLLELQESDQTLQSVFTHCKWEKVVLQENLWGWKKELEWLMHLESSVLQGTTT